jgi:hypothetical protein
MPFLRGLRLAAQPRPGAILGRSMRRRSSWLRCLRSRRTDDADDGANVLGRHVTAAFALKPLPALLHAHVGPILSRLGERRPGHHQHDPCRQVGGTASLPGFTMTDSPWNRSPGGCLSGSYRPPPWPTDGA